MKRVRERNSAGCLVMVVMAMATISCGDETNGSDDVWKAGPRETYPAGPYGTVEGAVVEDITFVDGADNSVTLESVFKDTSNRLLLVVFSAQWCAPCLEEQPTVQSWYASYAQSGLEVMIVLTQYDDYTDADAALVTRWQEDFEMLTMPVLADVNGMFGYFGNGALPLMLLIDVDTMTVRNRLTSAADMAVALKAVF